MQHGASQSARPLGRLAQPRGRHVKRMLCEIRLRKQLHAAHTTGQYWCARLYVRRHMPSKPAVAFGHTF
jgi:hypothetical protein